MREAHVLRYAPDEQPSTRAKYLPQSARLSRCARLALAATFDTAMTARRWTSGQVARWLNCSETFVRQMRAGDRRIPDHVRAELAGRGLSF
jgi:hypothetical protein